MEYIKEEGEKSLEEIFQEHPKSDDPIDNLDRRLWGFLFIVGGIGLIVWAVLFDPTVEVKNYVAGVDLPDRVVNYQRLMYQGMIFLGGLTEWISGLLCLLIPGKK